MTAPLQSDGFEMALGRWIQAQYRQPAAVADLRRRFQDGPERYRVIDKFLVPEHPQRIRKVLLVPHRGFRPAKNETGGGLVYFG
ncbi:MAG: hypothetical protein P4M00_20995 [Azospirillaceae bacterium]|nr:hypothetical protein [Azospirillaceae bacterium]